MIRLCITVSYVMLVSLDRSLPLSGCCQVPALFCSLVYAVPGAGKKAGAAIVPNGGEQAQGATLLSCFGKAADILHGHCMIGKKTVGIEDTRTNHESAVRVC